MASMSRAAFALLSLWACPTSGLRHASEADAVQAPVSGLSPLRHFFVAGPLGVGFEFWRDIMRDCIQGEVCQARDSSFYTSLMFQQNSEKDVAKAWGRNRPAAGRLVPLNLISPRNDRLPDTLFIRPYAGEARKMNDDPDLPLFHRVAQKYGDILKVIVMIRNEQSLLVAYMKDQKCKADKAEAIAVENVNKLAAQLRQLPKNTFRCQRYEDLTGLGEHLAPMLNRPDQDGLEFIHNTLSNMFQTVNGCHNPKRCKQAPKLRAALDDLESLCDPMDLGIPHGNSTGLNLREIREREAVYDDKLRWLLD